MTMVVALALLLVAFQVQQLRLLVQTIEKLNELLELLRDATRPLSPTESKQIQQELEEIRAQLVHSPFPSAPLRWSKSQFPMDHRPLPRDQSRTENREETTHEIFLWRRC